MNEWSLNNCAVIFITAAPEAVWEALTDPKLSAHFFMGQTAHVGEEGGVFRLGEGHVTGKVLIRQPPNRLRVDWIVPPPPNVDLPNCEVEFQIEAAETPDGGTVSRLTVSEFVDGPVPSKFVAAGRVGWGLILSGLKTYLETGAAQPSVRLHPPG